MRRSNEGFLIGLMLLIILSSVVLLLVPDEKEEELLPLIKIAVGILIIHYFLSIFGHSIFS